MVVNAERFDPYKNFKFKLKWGADYVAGVSKISGLGRTTEVAANSGGGDPSSSRKSPGRTEYEAITVERGITHDKEFEQWANTLRDRAASRGNEVLVKEFRKDVVIEVYTQAGQLASRYKVFSCWVSEFQASSGLDSDGNAVLIEHLKLENEGWERDCDVPEPVAQTFAEPPRAV